MIENAIPTYAVYLTDPLDSDVHDIYTFDDKELWNWVNELEDFSKTDNEIAAEKARFPERSVNPKHVAKDFIVPGTELEVSLEAQLERACKAMTFSELAYCDKRVKEFHGSAKARRALLGAIPHVLEERVV